MACCSSRRSSSEAAPPLRAAWPAARETASVPSTAAAPPNPRVPLRYLGRGALALRGPFSGQVYQVAARGDTVMAEAQDVASLLRSGRFEQASATEG